MFERFLHGQSSGNTVNPPTTPAAPSAPVTPSAPQRPAFRPNPVPVQAQEEEMPDLNQTEPVATPMSEPEFVAETPVPAPQPPMAPPRPVMPPMMPDQPDWPPKAQEDVLEEDFAVQEQDDNPETALPIAPEDDVVVPPPEMPSFLKAGEPQSVPESVENFQRIEPERTSQALVEEVSEVEEIAPMAPAPMPELNIVEEAEEEVPPAPLSDELPETEATPEVERTVAEEAAPVEPEQPAAMPDMPEPMSSVVMPDFETKPKESLVDEKDIVRGDSLHTVDFADIWYTPEGNVFVRDKSTRFALTPIETPDLEEFHDVLEQGFSGQSSYAVRFAGDAYRVERVMTADGLQYNCRKMPTTTPEIETLGFAPPVVKHLTSLSRSSGLLLFAGPTGQGKTTTVSALMKRFLDTDGGFLYTIEDPPEMPLSGIYHSKNGGLGLCKQVPVENDQWGAGLRSALRSKPRYILVGEIRTPETASQCLVAATSGHLVLSTIHANSVEDALNSMVKYAASTGLDSSLAADLLARGVLGVVHQRLEGTSKLKLVYESAFANPNPQAADQMRMAIRDGKINLSTFMEQQKNRMDRGLSMFREG